MAKAWIYQDDKQVKKYGDDKASWYVGWIDPAGKRKCKSCGGGKKGKRDVADGLRAESYNNLVPRTQGKGSQPANAGRIGQHAV
jgi:hypothetical protein